jgi:enoyl-CoA hydratase/carnithine racemase
MSADRGPRQVMPAPHDAGFDVELDAGIAVITFNRPEKLNSLSRQTVLDLCEALNVIEASDQAQAVVFTGRGRAFSAGADLSGGASTFRDQRERKAGSQAASRDFGGILALRLFASTLPLVAAVNGDAVGLGVTMTLPMDVRIAADTARFGFVFSRRGIVPEACSSWFLPRVVGVNRALEWTMSGRLVPADEALEAGLVRKVVPAAEVLTTALAHARRLVEGGAPVSVAATRQMMWHGLTQTHPMEAHRVESDLLRSLGSGPDAAEGVSAFIEKRAPHFPTPVSEGLRPFRRWWPQPDF